MQTRLAIKVGTVSTFRAAVSCVGSFPQHAAGTLAGGGEGKWKLSLLFKESGNCPYFSSLLFQMAVFINAYVPLGAEFTQSFTDEAAAGVFKDANAWGLIQLRKTVLEELAER